jgi:2-polyprenyl-3-methyl-5-hydroxy-6-metoxy-1,4-benzoquinol methylase
MTTPTTDFDAAASLEDLPCNLCGIKNEDFLFTKAGVLTHYPFRVVRCRTCGLIYLNPRLRAEAVARLYDQTYYAGKGFDSHVNYLEDYERVCDQEKIFRPDLEAHLISDHVSPPARLLDYGCGLGDLLRKTRDLGFQVEGFDVSEFAKTFAANHGFQIYDAAAQIPSDTYDVITAVEVLEHCASPMDTLRTIYNALKPGGLFYYTTENFDGYYEALRKGNRDSRVEAYIVPEGHIHFFSTAVMEAYFKKIGFSQIVPNEPRLYIKPSRLFKALSRCRLIDPSKDRPGTLLEKALYGGGEALLQVLGRRHFKKRFLPLARK